MAASKATQAANKNLELEVKQKQSRKKELLEKYKKQEQVEVSGSPFYKPYFGQVMTIMINGITVAVPLDGVPHKIPKVFADEFKTRIGRIDAQNERLGILGANMEEDYIGEVDIDVE